MKAEASVSTNGEAEGDDVAEGEPQVHPSGEQKERLEDTEYNAGYMDVVSDFVRSYRLYLFALLVLGLAGAWYVGVPRYAIIGGVSFLLSVAVSWSPVFAYVSKFDDGADNFVLEVSPDDDGEHHCYEAGDGALVKMESEDGTPAYPVRGVPDVYEVEKVNPEEGTYCGSLRAALPYSKYVEVEYMRQYYREHVVPLADRVPKLEAQKTATELAGSISRAVEMVETIEKGLNGDVETDDKEDSHELDDLAEHARNDLEAEDINDE
jgi:hypothetical protein